MKILLFFKAFELEASKLRMGVIYYVISIICLLFITTIFLSGLYNIQDLVVQYSNQISKPVDIVASDGNNFSNDFLKIRIPLLLEALKWQFWIFLLILLKIFFLVFKRGWSFFFSVLLLIAIDIVLIIYYRWAVQLDDSNYLTFASRAFLGWFNTVLLILTLTDITLIMILLFRSRKTKIEKIS